MNRHSARSEAEGGAGVAITLFAAAALLSTVVLGTDGPAPAGAESSSGQGGSGGISGSSGAASKDTSLSSHKLPDLKTGIGIPGKTIDQSGHKLEASGGISGGAGSVGGSLKLKSPAPTIRDSNKDAKSSAEIDSVVNKVKDMRKSLKSN